jgi:1-acyl-sn-glycerol-3-phosphate acyltransferase
MKRIILMVIRSIFNLPFWMIRLYRLGNAEKYNAETRYAFLHRVTPIAIRRGRIKILCTGLENLPRETGYVIFPNHQGMFDVLAFIQTHERPFVTVMKKEVKKNFFLQMIVNIFQAEVIDREDIRQSMQVIMNMTRRVQKGENFIIFAEGTRSRNGNELLDFKGGSFKSAMNAKCPIVPVALIDSYKAFDSGSIAKLTVQIHYLKPLYYEDYKDMRSTEIAQYVSSIIREEIKNRLAPDNIS